MSQKGVETGQPVHLLSLDPETGQIEKQPLPLPESGGRCKLHMRTLSGASALHLALSRNGSLLGRCEVEAGENEELEVHLEWTPDQAPRAQAAGRRCFTLPADEQYAPLEPFTPAGSDLLDLIVLVDGTTRCYGEKGQDKGLLLEDQQLWSEHLEALMSWIAEFSQGYASLRLAALAFADEALPRAGASDLQPLYSLYPQLPSNRQLAGISPSDLKSRLLSFPASTGADFTDALADALDECASARWRPGSRRIVLLSGDSPGYSVLNPPPWGANASIRQKDVESALIELHRRRVELVAIYHPVPSQSGLYDRPETAPLLDYARSQYQKLASRRRECFFQVGLGFDPRESARSVSDATQLIVRGAALGHYLSALPGQ